MTRKLSFAAVGAASLLLAACGSTESGTVTLALQHEDCQGVDVLPNSGQVEVTVTGPGMDDVTGSAEIGKNGLSLGDIPAGKDRQVTVRVTAGTTLRAVGHSEKFAVKATEDVTVSVPMVGLNRLHPTATAANECTMPASRAGQSAAAFSDGRALLVGGIQFAAGDTAPTYLSTVELYEPSTGAFRALPDLPAICGVDGNESCARAFAPGLVQPLTSSKERFLVIGGEYRDAEGHPRARGEILAFDPATETWSTIEMKHARRFHTATLLVNNDVRDVVIIGGFGNPADNETEIPVVGSMEVLKKGDFTDTRDITIGSVPRALHAAIAYGGGTIVVAGGVDGTGVMPTTVLKVVVGNAESAYPQQLANGVIGPSLATFLNQLVVVGGVRPLDASYDFTDPLAGFPQDAGPTGTGSSGEQVSLVEGTPGLRAAEFPLAIQRAFACSAPIDRTHVLVAGGIAPNGGVISGESSAEILTWVDESQCVPFSERPCTANTECNHPSTCVDGACLIVCTDDSPCGTKGSCQDGYCKSDLTIAAHRCTAGDGGCFAGSVCQEAGHLDRSNIGSNSQESKLLKARAWGSCTRLSDDQILISGGVSEYTETLGEAEIYEIMNAGR